MAFVNLSGMLNIMEVLERCHARFGGVQHGVGSLREEFEGSQPPLPKDLPVESLPWWSPPDQCGEAEMETKSPTSLHHGRGSYLCNVIIV